MINGRLNTVLMVALLVAAVPVFVVIVLATDRKPPMRNYRLELHYERETERLYYDASFFVDRECTVAVRDEIAGPEAEFYASPTHREKETLQGDVRVEFYRRVPGMNSGQHVMHVFMAYKCNWLQHWADWPVVQREEVEFTVR